MYKFEEMYIFFENHLTVSYNVYIIDYIREMENIGNVVKVYRKRQINKLKNT